MAEESRCPAETLLAEFAVGRLEGEAAAQVREHLALCATCAASVGLLRTPEIGAECPSTKSWSVRAANMIGAVKTEKTDRLEDSNFDFTVLEPSASPDSLGQIGKYEVQSLLGQGGMGVVLRAFDRKLDRAVAIKVLSRHLASSLLARRRFQREARTAAAINHPNVVTIHAVEEHRGLPFMVMELIHGPSLQDRIRAEGHLPAQEVMQLAAQIVAGLAAAHSKNVIHRDIKPGNVMVQEGVGLVKITDFGLARILVDNGELSSHHMIVGTPAYMAPEQLSGDDVDGRADLFSLGCLLYAMLSGQSPFQGRTSLEMAHKVVAVVPPPLRRLDPDIPGFLADMVARLLQKNPDDRFQSAQEVAEVLAEYVTFPVPAPPASGSGVARRPPKRRRPVLLAAGTMLLVLLGALAGWRVFWSGGERSEDLPRGKAAAVRQTGAAEITVAADGRQADYATITQALAAARPESVIRVLDGSTYAETIAIADPKRLRGVRLIAVPSGNNPQRPTLAAPNPAANVIDINSVSGFMIRGFEVACPSAANALVIRGALGDVVIEDVRFRAPAEMQISHPTIAVNAAASAEETGPITIRRCAVERPALGQCVMVSDSQAVRLLDNRFHSEGVLVLLWGSAEAPLADITVAGNLFLGGRNGVNLNLVNPPAGQKIRVVNNTFFATQRWIGLVASNTEAPGVTIANNLIFGAHDIEGDAPLVDKALENWTFRTNWWERDAANTDGAAGRGGRLAELKEHIDVLDRDHPDGDDFLRPAVDSPLGTSGAGGDLPTHIGARRPHKTERGAGKKPQSK